MNRDLCTHCQLYGVTENSLRETAVGVSLPLFRGFNLSGAGVEVRGLPLATKFDALDWPGLAKASDCSSLSDGASRSGISGES